MSLTAEERREVNRKNARRSTGPKTPEGRARAAQNALKHGLRAETLALPGEDAQALQQTTEQWVAFYQPASPAQRVLLDQAVYAAVQLDRCRRFQTATVARQVREAQTAWDRQREDEVAQTWKRLEEDPAGTIRALKRTAAGCARLIQEWEGLQQSQQRGSGVWAGSERVRATRLLGWRPELARDADGFWMKMLNLSADPVANAEALETLVRPENVPDSLWWFFQKGWIDQHWALQELKRIVADELTELRERAERLRAELDDPARAGAAEEALFVAGNEAARCARYERMYDGMFHRAYSGLLKAQAAEEEEEAAIPPAASELDVEAPAPAEPAPAEAPAPNEANGDGRVVPEMWAVEAERVGTEGVASAPPVWQPAVGGVTTTQVV